jgi:hypothetical protein
MGKRLAILGLALATTLISVALFAATAKESPETIVIDDCASKQSPVTFPHKAHQELTQCVTCHHTQEGLTADSDMEVKPCSACHLEPEAAETPKCSQMSTRKNPFHIACVGCHKESGKDTAPTGCFDCHPKK